MKAVEAARDVVRERFPECDAALLAGSVVRGEETSTSDLDIVIFDSKVASSFRESFYAREWPVEVFVHHWSSYREFFESDCKRGQPSMPRMVAEGQVLKWDDRLEIVKNEAVDLLKEGPAPWSDETLLFKRYFLTDALDDFVGCTDRGESLFIASKLAEQTSEFHLRMNGQWSGASKWMARSLRNYDIVFAERLVRRFDHFYKHGEKEGVVELVDEVLNPYGGRLFEGFSIGKKKRR
ncbi:nucleotidyltransferase domain-containing protein [Halobacillus sp. Nhm2S1]|uniref:nucleotidyltransferase domain-containing protein n=1 Tax=Halobacillus sp. Nhm2S1 TaxID=2866716 RepID=UPI001C73A5EA|nr:nucleotidyltransferase domain-containing protein [Halobacillus sp. Nhm2S1]MBX0359792.1 nucleotidyltransferase domain-containing protein [Halobacillus sp. Nhm2S1]